MSQDDYDDLYVDDIDMLELNKNLPNTAARATMEEDAMSKAVGEKLYGVDNLIKDENLTDIYNKLVLEKILDNE